MKSYFLIIFVPALVINNLSHCSKNDTNETSLEISLGLCFTKFPLNITTFDFYFEFTNHKKNDALLGINNSNYANESNDSDICSINCCTHTNSNCEFYLFLNETKRCYEFNCKSTECFRNNLFTVVLLFQQETNGFGISLRDAEKERDEALLNQVNKRKRFKRDLNSTNQYENSTNVTNSVAVSTTNYSTQSSNDYNNYSNFSFVYTSTSSTQHQKILNMFSTRSISIANTHQTNHIYSTELISSSLRFITSTPVIHFSTNFKYDKHMLDTKQRMLLNFQDADNSTSYEINFITYMIATISLIIFLSVCISTLKFCFSFSSRIHYRRRDSFRTSLL